MAREHMKKCSISLIIGKAQVKALRGHRTGTWTAKIKDRQTPSVSGPWDPAIPPLGHSARGMKPQVLTKTPHKRLLPLSS